VNAPPQQQHFRVQPFPVVSPLQWQGLTPPPLDWMVDGAILRGTVAMLSGDGGLGKSLLAQQLLTASATNNDWLGLKVAGGRAMGFFCEDDLDELWRRQECINQFYGLAMGDLEDVYLTSRVGQENVLMEFDRNNDKPKEQPLLSQLRNKVKELGIQLLVLDTLADVFAGNEIIRNQVRRFVSAMRSIALEMNGAVLLTAHPSLAGLNSGSGISGSTAWNNSVRSRLYLTAPKPKNDGDEVDPDTRFLKTMKANQGRAGGQIEIKWKEGVFMRAEQAERGLDFVDRTDARVSVLKAIERLCRNGSRMSGDTNSRTYVIRALQQDPITRRFSRTVLENVKNAALEDGTLVLAPIKRHSKQVLYIRPASFRFPEE
jgi:RecA-family ATPase